MRLIAILVTCFAVGYVVSDAAVDYDECKNVMIAYGNCVRTNHMEMIENVVAEGEAKIDDLKTCFTADEQGYECQFPNIQVGDATEVKTNFVPETVACIKKGAWDKRIDQLATCAPNSPQFALDALKSVEPHHSAMQFAAFLQNIKKMKKAIKECKSTGIDIGHWNSIKTCVRKKVKATILAAKQKRCDFNQACVDDAFTGHESCVGEIQKQKPDMCRCWTDVIMPEVIDHFDKISRRHSLTNDEKREVYDSMHQIMLDCDTEFPEEFLPDEMLPHPDETRRYHRHRREQGGSESSSEEGEAARRHQKFHKMKPSPIFCQCDATFPGVPEVPEAEEDTW